MCQYNVPYCIQYCFQYFDTVESVLNLMKMMRINICFVLASYSDYLRGLKTTVHPW